MRFLITSNTLEPGGAERQRVLLANELARRGHATTLQLLQAGGELLRTVSADVHVLHRSFRAPLPPCDLVVTGTTRTETAVGVQWRLRGKGWIAAVHNPVGPGAPVLPRDVSMALRLAHRRVALTASHAALVETTLRVRCTDVISNGVSGETFKRVALERAQRSASDYEYDLGFLGRLSNQHKGLDTLLAALASPALAGRRVLIAGTGPDEALIRRSVLDLGVADRVVLAGAIDPERLFRECLVVAMPSRYEGQPMALLEALAAKVPVVATDFSAACDYLSPRRRVSVGDAPALACALAEVLLDPVAEQVSLPSVYDMVSAYELLAAELMPS